MLGAHGLCVVLFIASADKVQNRKVISFRELETLQYGRLGVGQKRVKIGEMVGWEWGRRE